MVRGKAIRALLVEDTPGDATLAQCLLAESLGPTVDTCCAERLSAAVSRLEEGTFDVVLLDLLLPDASGLEALQQIVASFPFVPVVVLTGLDDKGIVTDASARARKSSWSRVSHFVMSWGGPLRRLSTGNALSCRSCDAPNRKRPSSLMEMPSSIPRNQHMCWL